MFRKPPQRHPRRPSERRRDRPREAAPRHEYDVADFVDGLNAAAGVAVRILIAAAFALAGLACWALST